MTEPAIFETDFWRVELSYKQLYLGRSVVLLKRNCDSLSHVNDEEWADLHIVIKRFEVGAAKAFGARMFNWCCLMNNAYQEDPPKPYVHWHVRPRYDKEVEVNGNVFRDPNFGHHYNRDLDESKPMLPLELRLNIIRALQSGIEPVSK